MRRRWISVAIMLAILSLAGYWQPNPNERHQLVAPSESPTPATESEDRWVRDLVRNLRKGGAHPDFVYRFSRSSAKYSVNGEPNDSIVFVYRNNPSIYIIVKPEPPSWARFVVNFESKFIDAPGWGTLYMPPSKTFCVLVLDRPSALRGIPVTGEADNPRFTERAVTWY